MTLIGAGFHPLTNKNKSRYKRINLSINTKMDGLMDGTGGQMKTFCKAHDAEPGGILCTAPQVSSPRRSPAGHQQRRKGALRAAAGQSQHFLAERLRRAERHDLAVLHLGTGAEEAV